MDYDEDRKPERNTAVLYGPRDRVKLRKDYRHTRPENGKSSKNPLGQSLISSPAIEKRGRYLIKEHLEIVEEFLSDPRPGKIIALAIKYIPLDYHISQLTAKRMVLHALDNLLEDRSVLDGLRV